MIFPTLSQLLSGKQVSGQAVTVSGGDMSGPSCGHGGQAGLVGAKLALCLGPWVSKPGLCFVACPRGIRTKSPFLKPHVSRALDRWASLGDAVGEHSPAQVYPSKGPFLFDPKWFSNHFLGPHTFFQLSNTSVIEITPEGMCFPSCLWEQAGPRAPDASVLCCES